MGEKFADIFCMLSQAAKKVWNPQCWICKKASSYRWDLCWSCLRTVYRLSTTKQGLFQFDPLLSKAMRESRIQWKSRAANLFWNVCERKGILKKWQDWNPQAIYWLPQGDRWELTALEIFSKRVGQHLGIPAELGFRKVGRLHQHQKNRLNRMDAELLFEPIVKSIPQRVLLFDDVESTGTSLDQCKYLLKNLGAKRVYRFPLVVNVMEGFERKSCQTEQESEEMQPFLLQLFV